MRQNFWVGLFLGLALTAPAWAVQYEITDLGGGSRGLAISSTGYVTGEFAGPTHAFTTAPLTPTLLSDLGTLGGIASYGRGINASGQVVGISYFDNASVNVHAFRTAPNTVINPATNDLGVLGGSYSYAQGINDAGQVVGYYQNSQLFNRAYRTTATGGIDAAADLGTLGGSSSTAMAINSSGQVTGFSSLAGAGSHAFRTTATGSITPGTSDLGTLVAGNSSQGNAINDFGAVAGQAVTSFPFSHAFYVPGDRAMLPTDDLGTLGGEMSGALGLNNLGWVVGASTVHPGDGENDAHAFIWYGSGLLVDLNTLIPANSGWVLRQAQDINEAGQITGFGYHNGVLSGFLLTVAVPEPGTLALCALPALWLLKRRRTTH